MIITTAIQKGGTGKTTTAAMLAYAASLEGRTALLIDLEPQYNLTMALGGSPEDYNAYDLMKGKGGAPKQIKENIYLVSGTADLATIKSAPGSARRLSQILEQVRDSYDLIIIDTPPTAGELLYNALFASDMAIIPLLANGFALQKFEPTIKVIEQITQAGGHIKRAVCFVNQYDARPPIAARQVRDAIEATAQANNIDYLGEVRRGIAIDEAILMHVNLFEYRPKSKPAQDFMKVYKAIIERGV